MRTLLAVLEYQGSTGGWTLASTNQHNWNSLDLRPSESFQKERIYENEKNLGESPVYPLIAEVGF